MTLTDFVNIVFNFLILKGWIGPLTLFGLIVWAMLEIETKKR